MYTCSKCGKPNVQISVISEQGDSWRHGTIHRPSTYEKMEDQSYDYAKSRINSRLDQIVDEAKSNKYRQAELKCRCQYCQHVEPWAKMRFSHIDKILGYLIVFVIFALFFTGIVGWFLAASLAAFGIFWFIFKKIRYSQLEEQISLLPKESLPTIAFVINQTAVVLRPETKNEPEKDVQSNTADYDAVITEELSIDSQEIIFCRKCGAKILSDSVFCDSCGEKIERV